MKWDGIALAITTQVLLLTAAYCGNRMVIFYWYYESSLDKQAVQGIPLTFYGLLNFIGFNDCDTSKCC